MTQPNPDDNSPKPPAAPKPPADPKPPAKSEGSVSVLDVVEYVHHDPLLGGEQRELGVVVGVDDQGVDVVPLAGHRVRVGADKVSRLPVDDLG